MSHVSIERAGDRSATLLAVGSVVLWCWSGVCFSRGGRLMGPMVYLTWMTATGAATVVGLQVLRRRPVAALFRIPGRVAVSGFFGVALYTVMLALAFGVAAEADLGQVNLLNYLWPIWIVLLSLALLDEKPRAGLFAGAVLGFGGVAVCRGLDGLLAPPADLRPHALALVGGFLWALYCVLLRRWRVPEDRGGTAFHFTACAAMAAGLAAAQGEWAALGSVPVEAWFWVLFGGVGPVGLAYHWWEIGIKRGSVHFLSLLAYFIPVGSSLLIGLFFSASMNAGLVPAALLIALGACLAGRAPPGGSRAPSTPPY